MKVYSFVRNDRGECTMYVIEKGERPEALPMVIGNEIGMAKWPQRTAATVMLLDYFSDEDDTEMKATALARLVANRLSRGVTWSSWTLTEAQLTSMIADIMVIAYTSVNLDASQSAVEYMGGERRDTLRQMIDFCVPSRACS